MDLLRELEGECEAEGWVASVGAHGCCLCYSESYEKESGTALVNGVLFVVCCWGSLEETVNYQDHAVQFFYKLSEHGGDRY